MQHTLLEYARNVLGIQDAEHEETAPEAPRLLIRKLSCSLVGVTQPIRIIPGTLAYRVYQRQEVGEQFRCNYGLNPEYQEEVSKGELRASGVDIDGGVRIVELAKHPFFVATLFLPQLSSTIEMPHPLVVAYLKAAMAFQASQRGAGTKIK